MDERERPHHDPVNNILTGPLAGTTGSPAALDLAGNFVRAWSVPPAFANGMPFKGMIAPLPNDDLLAIDRDTFSTCWTSTDLSTTWVK